MNLYKRMYLLTFFPMLSQEEQKRPLSLDEAVLLIKKTPKKGVPHNSTLAVSICSLPKYKDKLIYIKSLETMFLYIDNKYYRPVDITDLRHDIWNHIVNNFPEARLTDSMITDIIKQLPPAISNTRKNLDDHYIAFEDCLYDCDTFTVTPFAPEKVATVYLPFVFGDLKSIPIPHFTAFLQSVFIDEETRATDNQLIDVIQEIVGYLLVPQLDACAAFFLVGDGSNGKSTLTKVLETIFGDEYISSFSIETLTTRAFASAGLIGKRINICNEEESRFMKSDTFKTLISGDRISAERKFGNTFEFNPTTKFVFCSNQMPTFNGVNYGLKRRIKIIPFHRIFADHEQDKQLSRKLRQETGGIIAWALEGLHRLVANNYVFSYSQAMEQAMKDFVAEISSPISFMQDLYEEDPESFITNDELYEWYRKWCEINGRKACMSRRFQLDINKHLTIPSALQRVGGIVKRGRYVRALNESPDIMSSSLVSPF